MSSSSRTAAVASNIKPVRVELPEWIWGNNISGFLVKADLRRSRTDGTGYSELQTMDSFLRRKTPALVQSGPVLSAAGKPQGSAEWLTSFDDPSVESSVYERIKDHPSWTTPPASTSPLVEIVQWAQRAATFIPGTRLLEQAEAVLDALTHKVVFENSGEEVFPRASILGIRRSQSLLYRVKLLSVLLRVANDEQVRNDGPAGLLKSMERGEVVFGAGSELTEGVLLFDAYLLPLMAALTPHAWAFPIARANGTLVCSLGRAVAGTSASKSGLLDTLYIPGRRDPVKVREFVDPSAPELALHWWGDALNRMLGVVTDPVTFANRSAVFELDLAFQTMATVEQVFRRVGSSQMADGDLIGRRAAMFNAIDAFEGLTGQNVTKMLTPSHARKTLGRLESTINGPAAEILLPVARRATAALEEVASGFYLRNLDGTIPVGPSLPALEPGVATARYMYLLRNSTHGFAGGKALGKDGAALLAAHTGAVHHDVGLLGWLYLLDLLAYPDRLRKVLSNQARR